MSMRSGTPFHSSKYARKYSFIYVELTLLTYSLILKYFLKTDLSIEVFLAGTILITQVL